MAAFTESLCSNVHSRNKCMQRLGETWVRITFLTLNPLILLFGDSCYPIFSRTWSQFSPPPFARLSYQDLWFYWYPEFAYKFFRYLPVLKAEARVARNTTWVKREKKYGKMRRLLIIRLIPVLYHVVSLSLSFITHDGNKGCWRHTLRASFVENHTVRPSVCTPVIQSMYRVCCCSQETERQADWTFETHSADVVNFIARKEQTS
jgi:hypothetical protein